MTPERWREVKAVLGPALESPEAERAALLDRACGADADLRREVESLLAGAGDDADSTPAVRAAVAAEAAAVVAGGAPHDGAPYDDAVLRSLLEGALGGQYDVLRPLGRGGMGLVYLAWERVLERFVAVKVLRPDLAAARESRERFRREARIAAQLAHPGIVPLYTFGEVRGLWYFVMGYVRGESLAERLRLRGRLPCPEARRVLADLVDALACAHRHGVVHRDIKPANVLLDEGSGRAVLTDFGISKVLGGGDGLTASGAVIGTPRFMSPEQARGSADVGERSDIYSLGAVAYTMLAGRAPSEGDGGAGAPTRRADRPPPLERVAPSVPADLAAVVMRCLEPDPALRWPDARALKDALGRTEGGPAAPAEALPDVSGFGPYALVWALAWSALAALTARSPDDRAWLLLVALLVPVGLGLHVWNVERDGLSPRQFARLAFCPPRWWGMWWPAALRRPGDLWPRLPWQARLVRRGVSAFIIALPLTLLVRRWLAAEGVLPAGATAPSGAALERGAALGVAALTAGALAWALARGLSLREAAQLLFGATMPSSVWRGPNVARVLAPASHAVRAPEHDDPADHARAIAELARLLPADAAGVGAAAAGAADRIAAVVAAADREIAILARDAGSDEMNRLAARLTALEDAAPGEDDDHRQLRALVRHQLELVYRMRARQEGVLHRRMHLFELARGVWAQLGAVHDAATGAPATRHEAVARLTALCAEADDLLRALAGGGAGGGGAAAGAAATAAGPERVGSPERGPGRVAGARSR